MKMKTKNWIIPILFLALPFSFLAPGLIWKSQLLFFIICPIFIIALSIKNIWVKTFLLYASAWQITNFLLAFNRRDISPGYGLTVFLSLMAGAIIFKFVSESNLSDAKWFKIIRVAVILQILASLPQPWGFNPIMKLVGLLTTVKEQLPGHLVGTLGNRNYLAAFIAISIPFFIGWRTFKIKGISINPAIIGIFIFLFFCFSPGTLAAVIGVSFFMFYKESLNKRITAFVLTGLICAAYTGFYVLSTGNHAWEFVALPGQLKELIFTGKITLDPFQGDIGRFGMWMLAFSKLIEHWFFFVFGYGPGAFWGREYSIHGEYISVWFQFGLVGLALMIGYIYTSWKFLVKEKSIIILSSFLIICLDMIGNFPMEIASTAFMIVIICGLIERKRLNG